ncbi:MAG: diacylglycerol kinase family protein [Bryobacteraceae bacterium]
MTSYSKTVLIYNPCAGKLGRKGGALVARAAEILEQDGHSVTCCPTTGPRTAGALAREQIARGADLILAAGGDGTLNEVAEGMAHSQVPLGVLPAGTANVLAMEMKLGGDFLGAARRLAECRPYRISIGQVSSEAGATTRHFLLMAGIGLDAQIVYQVSAPLKARIGKLAYWLAGWSLLGRRLPEFSIEADGVTHCCSFALVSKVRNYGGDFEIARDVSLFDDHFELVLFQGRSTLRYVRYFAGLVANRMDGVRGITVLRARRVSAPRPRDERVFLQIDGEFAGHLPTEIRIVPDALTLLVPPEYRPELQQRRAAVCQG